MVCGGVAIKRHICVKGDRDSTFLRYCTTDASQTRHIRVLKHATYGAASGARTRHGIRAGASSHADPRDEQTASVSHPMHCIPAQIPAASVLDRLWQAALLGLELLYFDTAYTRVGSNDLSPFLCAPWTLSACCIVLLSALLNAVAYADHPWWQLLILYFASQRLP